MRSIFVGMGCLLVVACGSYKGSAPAEEGAASGDPGSSSGGATNSGTADQNAQPSTPIGGTPPSGIYVSSSMGSDSNAGAIDSPLKTLAKAFSVAKDKGMAVNACSEEFDEALTLIDGVSAYGYFDCTQKWVRGSAQAKINSPTSPALTAKGLALQTRIEGFEIDAPDLDGGAQGDVISSVALDVRDSQNLTFSAVLAHAGKGTPGADGTAAVTNVATYAAPQNGVAQRSPCTGTPIDPLYCSNAGHAPFTTAGQGGAVACAVGGAGGVGGAAGAPRVFDNGIIPSNASMPPADGQAGGGAAAGAGGIGGGNGAKGGDGAPGADGANGQWQLTADGFTVGNGTAGVGGAAASGGGGGGATTVFWYSNGTESPQPASGYYDTMSGAGGGAGGCAGQAGTSGTGGGASIAAFVVRSVVVFDTAHLESSTGGRAGAGMLGSAGTPGQAGGTASTEVQAGNGFPIAGQGGAGGTGGSGGASGHGAPGPSIALAYSGTRPTTTTTALVPGPGGDGQPALGSLPAVTGASEAEHPIE